MDFHAPFRGSRSVAAGLVTPKVLRGPRFDRLLPDIYVSAEVPVDLALRSRAAYLLVEGRGAVAGYSAAELLDASCGRPDAPAEVVSPSRIRSRPGLLVHGQRLPADALWRVDDVVVTSPLQTAYDLARRPPLVEAVVAVDALAHAFGFAPRDIIRFGYDRFGARGSAQLPEVVQLADRRAESPMETRIRLRIRLAGLPVPVLQHPVGPYVLDMAYPEIKVAVEYDGREHLTQARARRDLDRQAYLTATGWTILRFDKAEVRYHHEVIAARVRRELVARGVLCS